MGRPGRPTFNEEMNITRLVEQSIKTVREALNSKRLSQKFKAQLACEFAKRRIANKTEETGKVATNTTINVVKTYSPEVQKVDPQVISREAIKGG